MLSNDDREHGPARIHIPGSPLPRSSYGSQTVLIFTPHRIEGGGVVNFAETLRRNLGSDFKTEQFTMGRRPSRLGHAFRPMVPIYDAIRLARLLFSKWHDAYHINPSLMRTSVVRDGLFLLVLRAFGRRSILVYFHGWNEEFYQRIAASRIKRGLFRFVYGGAARVLVLASPFAEKLERLGLAPDRIRVVTTMFEGRSLQAESQTRQDRQIWILFMARLVSAKGVYEILQAFKRVWETGQDAALIMAGDGPEAQRARDWCAAHGIQHRVRFPGYVKGREKARLLLEADIFVLPSSHGEGCPISLLEAMGAGLPVVVTAVGGIPDVVRDGVNGFVLPTTDSEALAEALLRLVKDPGLRARMGQVNCDEAWLKYEAREVTSGIERQYKEIVALHSRAVPS